MIVISASMDSGSGLVPVVFGFLGETSSDNPMCCGSKTITTIAPHIMQMSQTGDVKFIPLVKFGDGNEVQIPAIKLVAWATATTNVSSTFMDILADLKNNGPEDVVASVPDSSKHN